MIRHSLKTFYRKTSQKYFLFLVLIFYSCGENPFESEPIDTPKRGEIVEILSETVISQAELEGTLSNVVSDLEINLRCGIKVYSVVYKTIDYDGNLTDASGLFVIPKKEGPFPMMSLHHGTQSKRENVGSQNALSSLDALLAGALGYVALSPDMLGLGISTLVHPYHVADVNANTVIDFIRAVKNFANENTVELNGQLFLTGYSQGGYTTMAVHKKIQEELFNELSVTASAPMAGAHDLLGTSKFVVENDDYDRPSFLAFITYAYSEVYNWNDLSRFFQSPYDNLIPTLFNGSLTTEEIDAALPNKLSELFNPNFLSGILNGSEELVTNALIDNSLLDWGPQAPVLIIHGDADTYVPYQNALTAKAAWEANGAVSVELITINGGDHISSIFPAIIQTIDFFEGLRDNLFLAANFQSEFSN